MEPVRPIAASAPSISIEVPQRSFTQPVSGEAERQGLDPAFSVELSPGASKPDDSPERRGYVREPDSQALVFQVTDAVSGDVIVQIPDEVVIKARAYVRQPEAPVGDRVVRSV